MLRKYSFCMAVMLFLSLIFMPGITFAGDNSQEAQADVLETGAFGEILDYIYHYHVDRPILDDLVEGAIDGLIKALDDPYTSYIPPESVDSFYESIEGNYAGIGVVIEQRDDFPVAVDIIEKSPAQLAGMKKLDRIIGIDGKSVRDMTLTEVSELLRGPEGTTVRVTVYREDTANVDLNITRANINAPTVFSEQVTGEVGYISISSFNSHTADDFKQALTNLKNGDITGLILDLRGNSGGVLSAAVDIAGHFLDAGQIILTTEDRFGSREMYRSSGTGLAEGLKVAVLVDGFTASASEILAGALGAHDKAALVGDKTYGKGVVQFLVPLESGGSLKVTVQKYFTPDGLCIHGNGIEPDRKVLTSNLQVAAAVQEVGEQAAKEISLTLGDKKTYIGSEEVLCEVGPYEVDGEVYLPLRFVLEALGYEVDWLDSLKAVEVTKVGEKDLLSLTDKGVVSKDGITFLSVDRLGLFNVKYTQTGKSIHVVEDTAKVT
ncbi:MAG TPA: S41 family peptidase [Clostridia bacterium]|nr:S41 family peptidase [Clostridia bacterium]